MITQFEQGNQARLDVTRDELFVLVAALKMFDATTHGKKPLHDKLVKKVREALDLYQ